jgi:hypothetical protein
MAFPALLGSPAGRLVKFCPERYHISMKTYEESVEKGVNHDTLLLEFWYHPVLILDSLLCIPHPQYLYLPGMYGGGQGGGIKNRSSLFTDFQKECMVEMIFCCCGCDCTSYARKSTWLYLYTSDQV